MKKIVLSAAALTLVAGSAFAAPVSGTVQAYDAQSRVIVFEGGKTVSLPSDVTVPANLSSGSQATVVFGSNANEPHAVLSR